MKNKPLYTNEQYNSLFFGALENEEVWKIFITVLQSSGGYMQAELPGYPIDEWKERVAIGHTRLGYWEDCRANELHFLEGE